MKVLVTGASGYIGGRLIVRLLENGYAVRAFARDPERLTGKSWYKEVETVQGDLNDRASIEAACSDIDAAYFLVHAMYSGDGFEELEKAYARNFAAAARGVPLIIYLGGLLPESDTASAHLLSRADVGKILGANGNITEFRAGPIIGSGSASFEMVRYLTERLPVMIVPRWVSNNVQPIGVRDVIDYLVSALEMPPLGIVEIGADILSFRDMMRRFADLRRLRRLIVPVPVLTPLLSGLWVGLITPVPNSLAVPLVAGILRPVVGDTGKASKHFPGISPISYVEAVKRALKKTEQSAAETRWTDSLGPGESYKLTDREGLFKEVRSVLTLAKRESVFRSFTSIGGDKGWLAWNWAWRLRGRIDNLFGGPGLKRGRRSAEALMPGDALDFWRVELLEPEKSLLLRAEMKVPGKAWLQFEAVQEEDGMTRLVQTAIFEPHGLAGLLYWCAMFPIHTLLFGQMAKRVVRAAEALEDDTSQMPETV